MNLFEVRESGFIRLYKNTNSLKRLFDRPKYTLHLQYKAFEGLVILWSRGIQSKSEVTMNGGGLRLEKKNTPISFYNNRKIKIGLIISGIRRDDTFPHACHTRITCHTNL